MYFKSGLKLVIWDWYRSWIYECIYGFIIFSKNLEAQLFPDSASKGLVAMWFPIFVMEQTF